jgi:hypothetical protein
MLSTGLSVSRLVNVEVSLTTPAVSAPAINSMLILGSTAEIDARERMRNYNTISEVAQDFPSTSPEFLAAQSWFSQAPRPENVFIGRWFKTAGAGRLICRPLSAAEQAMTAWNAITTGGFDIHINGVLIQVVALSFAAAANMNAVAAAIAAAPVLAAVGGANVVWDATDNQFVFTSKTTGVTSIVTFLAPPTGAGTPTDISAQLGGTAADAANGAYTVAGVAIETALTALTVIDGLFSSQFYAVVCPEGVIADHLALAAYCEAASPPHYYGVTTADPATLDPVSTTDLASQLSAFGYNKTAIQFSTTNANAISSYLARILTTAWGGQNTTITLMYKLEPGVAPEALSATQADTLAAEHCNVYAAYANTAHMIQNGVSSSGEFTDTIVGADALAGDVQTALFNVFYTTATKVPQTDPGMQLLLTAATATCSRYVSNGYLAEGTWNAQGFGTLKAGDHLSIGFYIYAPSMLLQLQADRAARRAPVIMIAAKCAGAIHTAEVVIFVNQ